MKTALIAGSTGLIGKQLLDLLLTSDQYSSVIALTRTALALNHPKLHNIIAVFNNLDEPLREVKADDVFCCLGATMAKAGSKEKFYEVDFKYPFSLGKATLKVGAKQYLLISALGADKNSSVYYNRVKGELEGSIRSLDFEAIHIFRPSLLLGSRAERRPGEDVAKFLYKVFGFAVPQKYKAIHAEKVARAMLAFASKNQKGVFIHESQEMQQY